MLIKVFHLFLNCLLKIGSGVTAALRVAVLGNDPKKVGNH